MTAKQFNAEMRAAAVGWLRYDQKCFLVCCERSPFNEWFYRPDIIGVESRWRVLEIEVKHSLSDFKANASKRGHKLRWQFPLKFYFAVPPALVEAVKPLLPEGAGLMTLGPTGKWGPSLEVIKGAKSNKAATTLSRYAIGRMIMHQTGTLHRALVAIAKHES